MMFLKLLCYNVFILRLLALLSYFKKQSLQDIFLIKVLYLLYVQQIASFIRSYIVLEGFPDSVTPTYVPYLTWRELKVTIMCIKLNGLCKQIYLPICLFLELLGELVVAQVMCLLICVKAFCCQFCPKWYFNCCRHLGDALLL